VVGVGGEKGGRGGGWGGWNARLEECESIFFLSIFTGKVLR